MCADPKYSVAGFEERDDPIFTQALRFGIAFDMFFDDIEPTQAAADRSDPKHPGTILEQCADLKGVDGMRNGEFGVVVNNLNTIPVVFVQSPVETSDPDVPGMRSRRFSVGRRFSDHRSERPILRKARFCRLRKTASRNSGF